MTAQRKFEVYANSHNKQHHDKPNRYSQGGSEQSFDRDLKPFACVPSVAYTNPALAQRTVVRATPLLFP